MRIAFAVTLACGLAASFLAMAQTPRPQAADVANNPFANDPRAIQQGATLFDRTCSGCHGPGATGGRGPALASGVFQHGGSDNELFTTIRSGVQGTQMPSFSALPSDDVWRLVTYIKSLSGQTGAQGVATGDAANGEALFFGKGGCTSCHEINGRGADLAADLSAEGAKPVGAIKTGVLHQIRRRFPPMPHFADVVTADGKSLRGLVRNEDAFFIQLEMTDGSWATLDKKDVRSVTDTGSALPTDTATKLSAKEIDDVVAFLAQHKVRDFAQTAKLNPAPVLPYARLANPKSGDWPTYWGDYQGTHFSALDQINAANVKNLQMAWMSPLPGTYTTEATPIVVDGIMYAAGGSGDVFAFDARTGHQIWAFHRKQDIKNPYQNNPNNKGVAVLDGRVFVGTLDDLLIAIDAHTGRELWEVRTDDTLAGYQLTGAPLAVDGKIIMGMSGGELGVRGYLDAYDPATGKRLWRTYTTPGPGEKGNETWAGDSWKTGGAPTWLTGSYDPEQHLLIWGTGNPGPDYNGDVRPGDNLYSCSVVALDPDSGKLRWHFQYTPHDVHDWDSSEVPVLIDAPIDGKERKLLVQANRNSFFYVLDRATGQFITGKAFGKQTWAKGLDDKGHPILIPGKEPTSEGTLVYPGLEGSVNWPPPSYSPDTGLFYVHAQDNYAQVFYKQKADYKPGQGYNGGDTRNVLGAEPYGAIKAIEATTGKVKWEFKEELPSNSGILTTAGGLLFAGTHDGYFYALNASTGDVLWNFQTGGQIHGGVVTFLVEGKQYVAVAAGGGLFTFAL